MGPVDAGGWRRAAMLVLVGATVAGCGGEQAGSTDASSSTTVVRSSTTAAPSTTAPPACPESGLKVTAGTTDAAMGLRVMGLRLTNCGAETTTVSGYPEVTVLDEDRSAAEVAVHHGAEPITANDSFCTPTGLFDAGPQQVTLAPGERALAGIVWRNLTTDEFDQLVNGAHLSIAPTAGAPPQEVTPDGVVDLGTTGRLGVSAWRPDGGGCS